MLACEYTRPPVVRTTLTFLQALVVTKKVTVVEERRSMIEVEVRFRVMHADNVCPRDGLKGTDSLSVLWYPIFERVSRCQ